MPEPIESDLKPIIGSPDSGDRKSATSTVTPGVTGTSGGPSGDTNRSDPPFIEPATIRITDSGTRTRRDGGIDGRTRAGRAARGRTGSAASAEENPAGAPTLAALFDISNILVGIHGLAATLTGFDGLVIEDTEADKLRDALMNVAKHYPVGFDPKKMAWFNLAIVAGNIYSPRAIAWRLERAAAKSATPPEPAKVETITRKPAAKTNGVPTPASSPMYPSTWNPAGPGTEDNN